MSFDKKKQQFSLLFDQFYKRLYNYALKVLKDADASEELVHETFIKLWENIETINDDDRSIESFLIVTLKRKIIDDYRKRQVREKHHNVIALHSNVEIEMDQAWELSKRIESIYASLPERTSVIFRLSREKGLFYKEIAEEQQISIKTVELHISKALGEFRKNLKDYL